MHHTTPSCRHSSHPSPAQPEPIYSRSRTSVGLLNRQRALTAHAIGLPGAPPPDLIAVDGGLFGILAGIKEIVPVVGQDPILFKGPARGPHALRGAAMRGAEADRLGLMRDDVRVLVAGRRAVDGEKGETVAGAGNTGAGDDQRLRVFLVLDLAEPGGAVGIGELEGLQVVGVEAAAADGEGEVARGGLA